MCGLCPHQTRALPSRVIAATIGNLLERIVWSSVLAIDVGSRQIDTTVAKAKLGRPDPDGWKVFRASIHARSSAEVPTVGEWEGFSTITRHCQRSLHV